MHWPLGISLIFWALSNEADGEFLPSTECSDGKMTLQNLVHSATAGQQFLKTRQSALAFILWHWSRTGEVACVAEYNFPFYFFFLVRSFKLTSIQSPGSDFLSTWEVVGIN